MYPGPGTNIWNQFFYYLISVTTGITKTAKDLGKHIIHPVSLVKINFNSVLNRYWPNNNVYFSFRAFTMSLKLNGGADVDPYKPERDGKVREVGGQAVWSLSSCKPGTWTSVSAMRGEGCGHDHRETHNMPLVSHCQVWIQSYLLVSTHNKVSIFIHILSAIFSCNKW